VFLANNASVPALITAGLLTLGGTYVYFVPGDSVRRATSDATADVIEKVGLSVHRIGAEQEDASIRGPEPVLGRLFHASKGNRLMNVVEPVVAQFPGHSRDRVTSKISDVVVNNPNYATERPWYWGGFPIFNLLFGSYDISDAQIVTMEAGIAQITSEVRMRLGAGKDIELATL